MRRDSDAPSRASASKATDGEWFTGAGQKGSASVVVDVVACDRVATVLKRWHIPEEMEAVQLPRLPTSKLGNFLLMLVAICHQTSPIDGPTVEGSVGGVLLRGWDYLFASLARAAERDHTWVEVKRWAELPAIELEAVFHDQAYGDTLSDIEGRASLLNDLGRKMLRNGWLWLEDILREVQALPTPATSILARLAEFSAFRDPVQKKSVFLLSLLRTSGLWEPPDLYALPPPVDYHEVRGHLRLGTVVLVRPDLLASVASHRPVSEEDDIQIRSAVRDAIMYLASKVSARSISRLHYLFWNVFRACCTRSAPHCHACGPSCSLAAQYVPLANRGVEQRRCPFAEVCASADREPRLLEHVVETDFY